MNFSIEEYSNAMDEIISKLDKIQSVNSPEINVALNRLCTLLRVGSIHVCECINQQEDNADFTKPIVLYDNNEADFSRFIEKRENIDNDVIVVFKVYNRLADTTWTELELEKINNVLHMIFIFYGRVKALKELSYISSHDIEYDFYNVKHYYKTARQYIAEGRINDFGLCFFNIRRMSMLNQILGRQDGTKVMITFVKGLEDILAANEFLCRIGGDNFAVMFYKNNLETVKEYLSGREIEYNSETGEKVMVSASGGFCLVTEDVTAPTTIIDRAGAALNMARNVRRLQFLFYNDDINLQLRNKKMVESMFPSAIKNEEFVVYYQPKVNLKNYSLAGAEALCRWFKDGKMMPPGMFIPVLEQTQAVCQLDFYVLEHVCMDIRGWLDEGKNVVTVSVNMSRKHLGDTGLLNRILSIIDKYNVPHKYIEIELTETTTDVSFNDLRDIVTGLQREGIRTAVDDFGVGYSSLNLIKELPWDVLKIDKTFLEQHDEIKGNNVMLKYVISMAQEMGMEVIVEGVETVEQIKLLKRNKCYLAQGFYFDRPLPKKDFIERMSI